MVRDDVIRDVALLSALDGGRMSKTSDKAAAAILRDMATKAVTHGDHDSARKYREGARQAEDGLLRPGPPAPSPKK